MSEATPRRSKHVDWSKMRVTHNYEMTPEIAQALIATPQVSRALAEILDKEMKRRKAAQKQMDSGPRPSLGQASRNDGSIELGEE
jgi:hypothetical protein